MSKRNGPWTVHDSAIVYENRWIRVRHDRVTTPSGTPGVYGVVETRPAVGIVVLDDEQKACLVGQHRYPLGVYSWEIPEGAGAVGETPEQAARRELAEETGLSAARWTPLGTMQTSNCITDEVAHLYLAEELMAGDPHPDDMEQLAVRMTPFSEVMDMVRSGEIQDAMTIVALYRAERILSGRPAG